MRNVSTRKPVHRTMQSRSAYIALSPDAFQNIFVNIQHVFFLRDFRVRLDNLLDQLTVFNNILKLCDFRTIKTKDNGKVRLGVAFPRISDNASILLDTYPSFSSTNRCANERISAARPLPSAMTTGTAGLLVTDSSTVRIVFGPPSRTRSTTGIPYDLSAKYKPENP